MSEKEMDEVLETIWGMDYLRLYKGHPSISTGEYKYAKYYRSIGYNSKVLSYEELKQMQEKENQYIKQFERSECI